jgi:hypothetical protein
VPSDNITNEQLSDGCNNINNINKTNNKGNHIEIFNQQSV